MLGWIVAFKRLRKDQLVGFFGKLVPFAC